MPGKEVQDYEWGKNMIVTVVWFMCHGISKKDYFEVLVKSKTKIAEYKELTRTSQLFNHWARYTITYTG